MAEIINREAGNTLKGPRLQKLRAIALTLDAVENSDHAQIYAAVEYKGDLLLHEGGKRIYIEEDKNYDQETTFTFNSHEIINTIAIFLDIYLQWALSDNIYLGFYSTNAIGKEKLTEQIKKIISQFPDKPVLELLRDKDFNYPNLLEVVKALSINYYEQQYKSHNGTGHLATIKTWTDDDWKYFLLKIDWGFDKIDEVQLKKDVLAKIQNCKYFNQHLENKEEYILATMMEKFDEGLTQQDPTEKIVHASQIKLIFKELEPFSIEQKDPAWKMWKGMPDPSDKRNIRDKIIQICSSYSHGKIESLSRKVGVSRIEQESFKGNKDFLAVRYRIYLRCAEELEKIISEIPPKDFIITEAVVDGWLHRLSTVASEYVKDLSTDFKYSFQSKALIENIFLELIDSCYLSFDKKTND